LYPLTIDKPKALLPIRDRTILDLILDKVERVSEIDEIVVVSNARFFGQFQEFIEDRATKKRIVCLDDGSTTNENRLGAIADLRFAVREAKITDDALVLAADNLFDFELTDFATFFREKGADCVTTHQLDDLEALRRTGVIELDRDNRVLSFEEKPRAPRSHWAVPPFYLYRPETLASLDEYLQSGANPDAPGHLIPWLLARKPVYAFAFSGRRYDIGDKDSYAEACRIFG
jgi:glucose-1-phosphate thymidylyltransferase